eukprot:gnl/MRDRNA2_/MRDRNA2_31855_c0_seq1.p1 gnl/MRDRNA2_/MRDRNA2_31855_c0~~gnl/MRDRNA2_/MRDRNA2_31855_c0_seq1.p1  ORF type:complete len:304 (+),score=46.78 gnl/MRDRNA2_/MRDRNA2_31855_c0_seq1:125-1036(+)
MNAYVRRPRSMKDTGSILVPTRGMLQQLEKEGHRPDPGLAPTMGSIMAGGGAMPDIFPKGPSTERYSGSIKWYSPEKERGMIESREVINFAGGEVVILKSNLKGVIPVMGDKCTFQVVKTHKGWKAVELQWQSGTSAADRDRRVEIACSTVQRGFILSYDEMGRGFGFIRCEEIKGMFQRDIFFMKTQLKGQQSWYPEGTEVYFKMTMNEERPQATHVATTLQELESMTPWTHAGKNNPSYANDPLPTVGKFGNMSPAPKVIGARKGHKSFGGKGATTAEPEAKRRKGGGWDESVEDSGTTWV